MEINNIALLFLFQPGHSFFKDHFLLTIQILSICKQRTLNCDTLLPTTLANLFDIQDIYSSSTAFYYDIYIWIFIEMDFNKVFNLKCF